MASRQEPVEGPEPVFCRFISEKVKEVFGPPFDGGVSTIDGSRSGELLFMIQIERKCPMKMKTQKKI